MFWGLNLKPNRKYTQTSGKAFHISQAALDIETSTGGANQILVSCENQRFIICTLRKETCEQVMLDLNFNEGEEICFQSIGSGNVTLSGYMIEEDNEFPEEDDDSEEEAVAEENIEDLRNTLKKKAKAKEESKGKDDPLKSLIENEADEDDDEDDSDFNLEAALNTTESDDGDSENEQPEEEEDEDDVEDDDEGEDEDDDSDQEEEEEVAEPKAKQAKIEKQKKKPAQQNGIAKEGAAVEKIGKKDKKGNQAKQQLQQQKPGGERTLSGGVKIEDIRVGNGSEAKQGKRVQVFYEGRLKSNNKVFDSLKNGAGFKFGLGRGEVIKGWDIGLVGMKVGGKRRIICPPHMAYGSKGAPPTIPPNSTLVFEIELKGVN